MGVVECGGVDYTSYYGEVTLKRKGGASVKFGQAKNYDEEFALKAKQGIADGDTVRTGEKSFITIMGHPQDGKTQIVFLFPQSEAMLRKKGWKATIKGEERKGEGISEIRVVKGTLLLYPAGAKLEVPMMEIEHIDKKQDMKLIVDALDGMTVILPGSRMTVKGAGGKPHETWPAYGSMGMTELIATSGGMYEKSMGVDERAGMLSSAAMQFGLGMPQDVKYEESMMDYSARKNKEAKAKTEEAIKNMPAEADIEKMKKSGKVDAAQLEIAGAMAKAMKASGGAGGPAFAMNMLASMDFSKMKDLPGLTPEQRKQIEEGAPMMAKMQKELASGGRLAQISAQAKASEKYMELASTDSVAKKKMDGYKAEFRQRLETFSLPPYPKPDEKFRVK